MNYRNSKNSSALSGKRLMSVDALRGFDMFWIIGGSDAIVTLAKATGFKFLSNIDVHFQHTWGQFHLYDLIMPLFLFIVGVVMPIAFNNRLAHGEPKKRLYHHILKRVFILYILGLIVSGHLLTYDITKIHLWTDTLHAIAVGYLICSIMILELKLKWQIITTAGLLLLYWGIMALLPIPGYGAGNYEPETNLALYVDNAVLGRFQEGMGWTYIVSNITFVCSVMLGVFSGKILLSGLTSARKAGLLALIGICCALAGKIWGIWFPIIHHLWTSSMVLFAGGLSMLLLSLFYLVIDVWEYKKWAFVFIVIGMNAIAVYTAAHIFDFKLLGDIFVGGMLKWLGEWNDFVRSLAALLVIWNILYWMYRNKAFVKI